MKKVKIVSACFVPADVEGEMKTVYPDSVLSLDDDVAVQLVAAQRAVFVDKETKLVDTTKQHEAAAAERVADAQSPQAMMAAAIAQALIASGVIKPAEAPKA